jgi:site-specific DNA recombinase
VEAERRGARVKKKLLVDAVEAETVRLIYRLFVEGDQQSGPMGVKAITVWLNEHGYRTRQGGSWGVGSIHKILSNPVYGGESRFIIKLGQGAKKRKRSRSGRRSLASQRRPILSACRRFMGYKNAI